jgi:gamma-glutamylputrescine oxidase
MRCGLERLAATDVAATPGQAAQLEREHRALQEAGLQSAWMTGKRARRASGLDVEAALRRSDAGAADPFRTAVGFARRAEQLGAALFEQTGARRIEAGRRHAAVVTDRGRVRASAVVIATNRPEPGLTALHRHVHSVETTAVVVPPVPAAVRRTLSPPSTLLRDAGAPPHAWRLDRRGAVMVWQSHQPAIPPRQRQSATVARVNELMYEFSVLYPVVSGVEPSHGWTTTSCASQDGLMIAGAHRNFPRHLFAVGLGLDGLQGAFLAARLNLRHYLGAAEKGDELFGFLR